MTTDPQTADIEYRLTRLEENIRALTGMVESLVVIRHVGAYVPPTKPHVRGVEPTWAILDEAAELERFGPFVGEAAELEPWTSAAASARDEIERTASDSGLLSRTAFAKYLPERLREPAVRAGYEDHAVFQRVIDRLVGFRKALGLTQTDVAKRMGVGQSTVSGFETEMSDPRLSTLQRYARAVEARLDVEIERTASDSGLLSRTGNDGAPLGEVVHDEAAELVPSTAETAALTAVDLDALPHGAVVQDSDWEEWEKTLRGWYMRGMNVNAPSACPLSSKTLFECRGPLTVRAAD